jgi:hypothetical protein
VFSLPFDLIWHFGEAMELKWPNSSPVLLLNAKGGEIKAKATGSANHLWISNILVLDSWYLIKTLLLQKLFSYGGEIWLWEKGEFLAFDQIYCWKISWFAKTSVFGLEIGKRICFVKINQVVAKTDPIMPKPMCWGPSSSEGPQKHDLTMFSKCNIWTGTFDVGLKAYTVWKAGLERRVEPAPKLRARKLRLSNRKRNRLKEEKAI